MPELIPVDPEFVDLCKSLFGDAFDPADAWAFVEKMSPDSSSVSTKGGISGKRPKRGRLIGMPAKGLLSSREADGVGGGVSVGKADDDTYDVVWAGEFSKTDDDKRQAFGWASVVQINGSPVVDRQGDWITPDELEKAAYDYVIKSRKGGDQHKRDGEAPFHASDLIESFVVTPEKIEKMGLPKDTPVGWWVGYKVHNDETWDKIKKGHHTGFSIHGKGKRQEIPLDEAMGY